MNSSGIRETWAHMKCESLLKRNTPCRKSTEGYSEYQKLQRVCGISESLEIIVNLN